MNKKITRPQNMSQLDYLWTTYGSYEVSNKIDTENTIPTSTAIKEYISDIGAGITELDTEKVPDNKIKILGKTPDGEELTSILIDEDTKILGFKRHTITQEDIDSGWGTAIGEEWILLETSIGNFKIPIEDLIIKGQESDTIINQAKDGKIVSSIKINNPIINKSVTLKTTSDGLWADLILNPDTESKVLIIKSDKGVECKFNWLGTNIPVGFKVFNTFDEYQLETTESGVIYLVKDVKSIYFNGIKFSSVGVDPQDYYTKEEVYNREQVDAMITPHTNAYTKEESDALYSKIETTNKLRIDLDYESSRALEAESNINKELDRRVTWDESKSKVVLPSGGQLVGIKYGSDGSNPEDGATIAQLSKFDKMDFGSSKYPLNLNVPAGQRPTVQEAGQSGEEAHQIAYLSDFQTSVDAYTKAESDDKFANKTDVYTKSEVDDLISEPIDAYTKSESDQKYATKSEVEAKQDALISGTNIKTFNGQSILGIGNIEFEQGKVILVVSELPESGDSDKVYLVPNESSRTNDIYDEYLWIAEQSKWEFLGNKHVDVDLTNYYTKEEVDELITPHVNAYTKQESDAKYATIEVVNTKVDKVVGKQLSTEDYTSEEKEKLAGLSNYDDSEVKEDVSNNTQAISTLTQTVNSKVDKIEGKGLSTEDYTSNDKTKLAGIEEGAQVNIITSVSGRTGDVVLSKTDVGLNDIDNTSDINKPVSIAQQAALDKLKSDLESIIGSTGTDLSAHLKDFDNPHKVTKDQVGLGKVDNTADLEKPVSVATQEAINAVQSNLDKTNISLENHIADKKNPHEVTKEQVGLGNVDNTSDLDKPVSHYQQDALDELERRLQGSIDGSGSDLSAHISDFNNPHKVTKDQVGLGNVDNTADKDKPISDATQKALDSIKTETNTIIETHIADKNNPHEVTKEQIGLGEVTNDAQVKRSEMGVAGGVATLDQEGKVPSSQLPSFVDDVIEVDSYDNLPTTGEAGKIYVTKDTNLTYRWSGSKYVEISASLALGETSSTAYAGDKGKATTDSLNAHLADFNNPHKVDKAQVGLGNVDNTSDKDKPVSDATQQLINEVKESINSGNTTITDNLTKHIEDYNNPHKVTKDQVGLGNVDNTSDKDKPLSDAAKEAINEVKTLITSSGTDLSNHIKDYTNPHRVTAEQVGLGNVNNTSDLDKPISNATQKELDKLDAKIDKINTDQGTDLSAHLRDFSNPHKVTKEQIGLGNVDNTADLDKPISTATQKAIDDAKAANNTALDNHANRTDNPHKVTKDQVGLGNVDNTADINKPVSVAQQNALDTLSNSLNTAINNHVGNTNNPHQVTKEQVGLGKVDNTSDLEKPISVATQNAISEVVSNLDKHIADKNNPHEVTKEQIGLGRVDNTSDLEKPISTATQVALDKKAELGPDGKIPESQLPERTMHSLFYKGTWDAERNLPTLANGDKAQDGDYYLVNNDGESFGYKFMVNDIIFNASGIWYRMMGSNKRDNPTEFKITKFTADRTLLERGESTEITLEWEYQLIPSGQINFQFIDTHDIPVEERTYKITATGGQTFTLRGSYLSEVATATLTIDTADKVYVGASSNSAPTDSDFIAMNSFFSFGDNEFPFTPIDCSGGKYIYVAIPTEEYSKYRIYCNNYPVDDVTVYSRRITNIFTGYTDYTITKLANLYHGILNIEVKLIDKR